MRSSAVRSSLAGAACLALVLLPTAISAAPTCRGFTVTAVAFGTYDPLATTPLDSLGSVSYNCPLSLPPPQVTISAGGSGTFSPRAMQNPADPAPLQYNLFVDAARSTIWGDGSGGTVTQIGPQGKGTINVYGRVFPLQDVAAGTFSDTVIVTFNF